MEMFTGILKSKAEAGAFELLLSKITARPQII